MNEVMTPIPPVPLEESDYVLHRRFDRMGRLVGDRSMEKLFRSHVLIIGLGGVGSWAAESLARSGVGRLTLIDFDEVCITNSNRQLQALSGAVGAKKVRVLAERLKKINPQARIDAFESFYNAENSADILALQPDFVLDAIDNLTAKAHLIDRARATGQRLISAMGAGSRIDPQALQFADLADTHTDPLAHQLRKTLRGRYGFPEDGPWGVQAVFSTEKPLVPHELHYDKGEGFRCVCPQGQNDFHSCERRNVIHGTASFVTGSMGLLMSSWVVRQVVADAAPIDSLPTNSQGGL